MAERVPASPNSTPAQSQNISAIIRTDQRQKRYATSTVFLLSIIILAGAYICFIELSVLTSARFLETILTPKQPAVTLNRILEDSFNCSDSRMSQTCMASHPDTFQPSNLSTATCPDYFKWIHEDLRPWKNRGISREMVERAKNDAYFRLVIVDGKVYVEKYKECYETRDVFTIWGILQLLMLYPGKVPDLELMMLACEDRPVIEKKDYQGKNATSVPPLFHYCGSDETLSIIFPDWTFWGWSELNVRPWNNLLEDLKKGNRRTRWKDREPYAYWKGNHHVSLNRYFFMKFCNASNNTRFYKQNWEAESEQGLKNSKLEDQCTHRYKVYIEGWAWSVSEKYILACDSMVLFVKPEYFDFFTRSLVPLQHYWHIRTRYKCRDINFAVEWGNNHPDKAKAIGESASRFIQENVKMEYVYEYMLHLLTEYAKLLKFKPQIPDGAVEMCPETMPCFQNSMGKKYMAESMIKSPSGNLPCTMPASYNPQELQYFLEQKDRLSRLMEVQADEHWLKHWQ